MIDVAKGWKGWVPTVTMRVIDERQQRIVEELQRCGACTYHELAALLGVSTMTVRRDVDRLAEAGEAIKTLGGVQKAHAPLNLYESPILSRLSDRRQEKRAIARKAMELVAPGQTLFLDGGTTCVELARALASEGQGLVVITNSALVCMELGRSRHIVTHGIGGQFDSDSLSFVGPASEEWAGGFFVDLAMVSTKGFVPAEGTFESSVSNLRVKRIVAEHATRLALLVDHSKFGQRALCKVLDRSQIGTVVTDDRTGEDDLAALRRDGKQVLVAAVAER